MAKYKSHTKPKPTENMTMDQNTDTKIDVKADALKNVDGDSGDTTMTPVDQQSMSEDTNQSSTESDDSNNESTAVSTPDVVKSSDDLTETTDLQDTVKSEEPADDVLESATPAKNYPELGGSLVHRLLAEDEVIRYANVCANAFIALKSIRDSNREIIEDHLHNFCADYREAVRDGVITRDNYARGLNRVNTVSINQLTIFIGMIFEMYRNEVLMSDFRSGKSDLERYFKAYPIKANRAQAISLMSKIFLD